jgi:hypothetical protein
MRARDEAVSAVSLALKNADNSSSTAIAATMGRISNDMIFSGLCESRPAGPFAAGSAPRVDRRGFR